MAIINQSSANKKTTSKSIFVSSTFRDMQAERDILRDIVMPKINAFATEYGEYVELIDLRWGVNTADVSEEEQNNKVLHTCLDEIQRSRPFFIGILGDRYGWVPPESDINDAVESVEYSTTSLKQSVTSLEIEYGALNSPEPPVCLFYFRNIKNYLFQDKQTTAIYRDEGTNKSQLNTLKNEIKKKFNNKIRNYNASIVNGEVTKLKAFAEMVAKDIIAILHEEWGDVPTEKPEEEEQEITSLDLFRQSRTNNFAGRTAALQELRDYCLGENGSPILLVQGEAGSGKSALLCQVMKELEGNSFLLPASCGLTPLSSEPKGILRTLIWRLEKHLGLESEEASDDEELDDAPNKKGFSTLDEIKERFFELLHIASEKERIVVVIDALDQLTGGEEVQYMRWFNQKLPKNTRVLFSIIDGPQVEAIIRLGGQIYPVPAINDNDITDIIHSMAQRNHKQIADSVVEYILKKVLPDGIQAAQNPLYLSLLVQDLVMMDRYEHAIIDEYTKLGMTPMESIVHFMKERIDKTPPDAEGVFLFMVERLGKLIGDDFVKAVCGMIAISRTGLREIDLEGAFIRIGLKYNTADFSWLRQLLRGLFKQGDMNQWDFAHQSLRRALRRDKEKLKFLNFGIANYLSDIVEMDNFATREIIHHLCIANEPDIAAQVIIKHGKTHEKIFAHGLADAYIEHEDANKFLIDISVYLENSLDTQRWRLVEIFHDCLKYLPEGTRPFRIKLILSVINRFKGLRGPETDRVTALCVYQIARLYTETGETEKAEPYYQKSLNLREQLCEQKQTTSALIDLWDSYIDMGRHLKSIGKIEEEEIKYKESIDVAIKLHKLKESASAYRCLSGSYYIMGGHLMDTGKIEEAGVYYKLALDAAEKHAKLISKTIISRNLASCIYGMGLYLYNIGKKEDAGEYYLKSLNLMQLKYERSGSIGDLDDLSTANRIYGNYLTEFGELNHAEIYLNKAIDIAEALYGKRKTDEALHQLLEILDRKAVNLSKQGKHEEAGILFKKIVDMSDERYKNNTIKARFENLAESYHNLGTNYNNLNQFEKAIEYYQKAVDTYEQVYKQSKSVGTLRLLSRAYKNLGNSYNKLKLIDKVKIFYQKAIDVYEELYRQTGTMQELKNLHDSYMKMGDFLTGIKRIKESGIFYQNALEAVNSIKKINDTEDVRRNIHCLYDKIGDYFKSISKINEAVEYYQKSLESREQIFNQCGTTKALSSMAYSYGKMADCLEELGKMDEAMEYFKKNIQARELISNRDDSADENPLNELSRSYNKMGDHLSKLNKIEEAEEYYKKSLNVRKQLCEQKDTEENIGSLWFSYRKRGKHFAELGQFEKADIYYKESLNTAIILYEKFGTVKPLSSLISSYDDIGDNKYALGLLEEAYVYRLKALELHEQSVKLDPTREKQDSYYRKKIEQSKPEA
jgi:tetratricopeptide (TPR) repeat protein